MKATCITHATTPRSRSSFTLWIHVISYLNASRQNKILDHHHHGEGNIDLQNLFGLITSNTQNFIIMM